MIPQPLRGEIWLVSFDPTLGREQAGTRPALVLSIDKYNLGASELVVVLPLTSKDKRQPLYVAVHPPEAALSMTSFVKCDDVRSVSKVRLKKLFGRVSPATMGEVEQRMRILLGL